MRKEFILKAEQEAKRFLEKMKAYKEVTKNTDFETYGCRESGALKRSSLDLTRALADMRK